MEDSQRPQDQAVPWPSLEDSSKMTNTTVNDVVEQGTGETSSTGQDARSNEKGLSTLRLICLSISMLGVQVAWTLELALVFGSTFMTVILELSDMGHLIF
jgi:hypothetical protein